MIRRFLNFVLIFVLVLNFMSCAKAKTCPEKPKTGAEKMAELNEKIAKLSDVDLNATLGNARDIFGDFENNNVEKNPQDNKFKKFDLVYSKMSIKFQQEIKIPNEKKSEFISDIENLFVQEKNIQQEFSSNDLSLYYLIDKTHSISSEYEPENLQHLTSNEYYAVNKNTLSLRPEAYAALFELAQAATNDGIHLTVSSTYRSYEYQKNLFNYWVSVDGLAEAERESARPGTSQHQLGLALDFAPVDDAFDKTPEGEWVYKNAAKYGWSLSFPKGYEEITGYCWECWHFRYIGKFACEMQKKWFCDVQQYMIEFLDAWDKTSVE